MFKYVYNLLTVICLLLFSSATALSAAPYYITTDNLKYASIDLDWRQIPTFTTMDTVYLYSQPDKNSQIYYHVPPNEQLQLEDTRAYLYLYDSNIKMPEKRTIVIDYGGPNVAKPLHVGHLRSAIVGEAVKRILT